MRVDEMKRRKPYAAFALHVIHSICLGPTFFWNVVFSLTSCYRDITRNCSDVTHKPPVCKVTDGEYGEGVVFDC